MTKPLAFRVAVSRVNNIDWESRLTGSLVFFKNSWKPFRAASRWAFLFMTRKRADFKNPDNTLPRALLKAH